MKLKNNAVRMIAGLLLCSLFFAGQGVCVQSQAKTVKISKYVKVGKRIRLGSSAKGVSYKSSNSVIAAVDSKGFVTGKKAGKTIISVMKNGSKIKKYKITVKQVNRRPERLPVAFSEIGIKETREDAADGTRYQTILTNHAKKGTIKRVEYYYKVDVKEESPSAEPTFTPAPTDSPNASQGAVSAGSLSAEFPDRAETSDPSADLTDSIAQRQKIKLTAKKIKPGGKAIAVREGTRADTVSLAGCTPYKIKLYAGKALYVYDADSETSHYTFKWGGDDTSAPKIKGLVKKKSYTGYDDIYRVYYSDMKSQYNFKQFVTATDDRDGAVSVKVDASQINWKRQGVYKLWFTATDRAGNQAKSWAKVRVYIPGTAEKAADQILKSITSKSWSKGQKARAIYRYIRGHCSYIQHTSHTQWRDSALRGLRYHSGDCYTYYAMARLLLTRAGIPNVMVKRYPTPGGQRHFWNLAYVQGGWYHFDTTPRVRNANFCLWTDAQLWEYSTGYTFQFDRSAFPARATKRL